MSLKIKMVVKFNETLWNGNSLKEVQIATILMFRSRRQILKILYPYFRLITISKNEKK